MSLILPSQTGYKITLLSRYESLWKSSMTMDISMISTQNARPFPIIHQVCEIGRPLSPGRWLCCRIWLENNGRAMAHSLYLLGQPCVEKWWNMRLRGLLTCSLLQEEANTKPVTQTASMPEVSGRLPRPWALRTPRKTTGSKHVLRQWGNQDTRKELRCLVPYAAHLRVLCHLQVCLLRSTKPPI